MIIFWYAFYFVVGMIVHHKLSELFKTRCSKCHSEMEDIGYGYMEKDCICYKCEYEKKIKKTK